MKTNFYAGVLCAILSLQIGYSLEAQENLPNSNVDDYIPFIDQGWSDSFDWKVLKAFASKDYKNVIISPLSLKLVLGLLYEGAAGSTEKEFQNALEFPQDKSKLREEHKRIVDAYQGENPDYTLNLGTRVFLDNTIKPFPPFASRAYEVYQANISATNFTDSKTASNNINSWVDMVTNGRIRKLVSPDDIQDSILLITNAIYFKGFWRQQFPIQQSTIAGFYVSPTETITHVQYMSNTDKYFYSDSKDIDAKIVRIPYKGRRFSLFLILPNAKAGLRSLLETLSLQSLRRYVNSMEEVPVHLTIPKFKFDFQTRYSNFLQELDLKQMFQISANFPGIARWADNQKVNGLFVSDIIQKAGIEINEEGSTIYAASEVQLVNKFGEVENVFNATHPFLFFVEDQLTKTIVFVGKVENPLQVDPMPLPSRFNEEAEAQKPQRPDKRPKG